MKLNFRAHIAKIVSKAHQRCNILLRCFTHTYVSLLLKAFLIYVRPILEYASVVWSPSCSSLITELEKVQRRFTKCLSGLSNMSYRDRLKTLSLPTMEGRRLTADLIFCYKNTNGLVSLDPADFFVFHLSCNKFFSYQYSCTELNVLLHLQKVERIVGLHSRQGAVVVIGLSVNNSSERILTVKLAAYIDCY